MRAITDPALVFLHKQVFDLIQDALFVRIVVDWQRFGELLEQLTLIARQFGGDFHVDVDHQVAAAAPLHLGNALTFQPQFRAALRSFGDPQLVRPFKSRHGDFVAEDGLSDADRNYAMKIVLVPLEDRVFFDREENIEVAVRAAIRSWLAFRGNPQAVAVSNAAGSPVTTTSRRS